MVSSPNSNQVPRKSSGGGNEATQVGNNKETRVFCHSFLWQRDAQRALYQLTPQTTDRSLCTKELLLDQAQCKCVTVTTAFGAGKSGVDCLIPLPGWSVCPGDQHLSPRSKNISIIPSRFIITWSHSDSCFYRNWLWSFLLNSFFFSNAAFQRVFQFFSV